MIAIITWVLAAVSLFATVLNIHKNRVCFMIWTVTNASWMVYDYHIGAHAQAALMAVYTGLAVWGVIKWGRDKAKGATE